MRNILFLVEKLLPIAAAVLLTSSAGFAYADLGGDTVNGELKVRNITTNVFITVDGTQNMFDVSLGLTQGSGTPQVVGVGDEFYVHDLWAGAYGSAAFDQFLDVDVNIKPADTVIVRIGGNFLSNPGGIIPALQLTLTGLDFDGDPGIVITGVTAILTEYDANVTTGPHSIVITTPKFSTAFGGPTYLENAYVFNTSGPADSDGDSVADNIDNCTLVANADQRDTDGDNIGNICDPDFSGNCVVNSVDLGIMKINFFSAGDIDTDLNGDEQTNIIDLGILKGYFFGPPGPSASGCN